MDQLQFAISINFISWIVGLLGNAILMQFSWYNKLAYFNFMPSQAANRILGVSSFAWIIKNSPFKFFNPNIKMKGKGRDFNYLWKEMTKAEMGHVVAFAFVVGVSAYVGVSYNWVTSLACMLVNIPMNVYPVLLQQFNKRRIRRFIKN